VPAPPPRTGPEPRARRAPPPRRVTFDAPPEPADDGWAEVGGPRGPAPWPTRRGRTGERWPGELPFPVVRVGVGSVVGCLARSVVAVVVFLLLATLGFFGYCGTF
jgi:hypothetical protein